MNYYDSYDYGYGTGSEAIVSAILAVYLIVLAVLFIFYIISYVFKGIGMYTIAKRQGMDYPWLAFIPFARAYLHGELAGRIALKEKEIKNPGIWVLVMPFIAGAINFVFFIIIWGIGFGVLLRDVMDSAYGYGYGYEDPSFGTGAIMGLIVVAVLWVIVVALYNAVFKVLVTLVNHQVFGRFTSKNMSIAHAVFSSIIPLYESICFFVMRNRDYNPGMKPDFGTPFIQEPPIMPPTGGPAQEPYHTAGQQPHPPVPPAYDAGMAAPPVPPAYDAGMAAPPPPVPSTKEPFASPAEEYKEKPAEEPVEKPEEEPIEKPEEEPLA